MILGVRRQGCAFQSRNRGIPYFLEPIRKSELQENSYGFSVSIKTLSILANLVYEHYDNSLKNNLWSRSNPFYPIIPPFFSSSRAAWSAFKYSLA
jgi:hypothetical protein